jgi:lauroyl/myristoyl acyltransferase
MAILIKSMGFLLSLCPFSALEGLTSLLGRLFVGIPSGRRRVLLSNLSYVFPHRKYDELLDIARKSAARMFEMGFFSLCYPFLGKDKLRRSILYTENTERMLSRMRASGDPIIIMIPHVCLLETLATSPHFRPQGNKRFGAIYRPNKNKALDDWINSGRLSVGIDTFSRKAGFSKTKEFLRRGNWLGVLFDQNAGNQGTLSFFLDRLASITSLPDLLQKATKARAVYASPRRLGFFQSSLELIELDTESSISFGAHDILADKIESHPHGFPDWLWSHSKWKTHYSPKVKFGLKSRRKLLPMEIPRKLVFFIQMPNWLGDIIMAAPVLLALSKSRPDVKLILICKPQ